MDQSAPESKVHGANMGLTWVLSAPNGPYVDPMYLAIRVHCDFEYQILTSFIDFNYILP